MMPSDTFRLARAFLTIAIGLGSAACGGSASPVVPAPGDGDVTISGRVTAENGDPLAGVDVVLDPVSMATTTAGDGRYQFVIEDPGKNLVYVLEVRHEGYESITRGVGVPRGGVAVVDVHLELIPVSPEPDPEEPDPPEPDHQIVVDSDSDDAVLCIAPGVELPFTVRIGNEGDVPVERIVLHDTLDSGFTRILSDSDIVVDRANFPDAVVILNPDGRSFRVELGAVAPMDPAEVYTVTLPASSSGVFCNRVSAVGEGGMLLSSDIGCLTDTLILAVDLVNEDGAIVGGAFTPDPEVFHVGDGGPERPDALVYRVVVANQHCGSIGFPPGTTTLTSVVGARSGAVEFREVLPGFPTRGSVVSTTAGGLVWSIGSLAPGAVAEIRFRAEAIRVGDDVHRVVLEVPGPIGELVNEEPITIQP